MKRAVAIAGGLAGWIATTVAQAPVPAPQAPFRSGVEIVTIDVSVFDDNRRPVRGLTAADFTLLEGGKPLPIVAFKAIDLPDRRAYAAPWMRDVAPDVVTNNIDAERVVVLLLDDFNVNMDAAEIQTTRRIARAVVDELGPTDVAAVVYTFAAEKTQEFTADRARLHAAVDRFTSSKLPTGGPAIPSMMCPYNECVTTAMRGIAEVLRQGWSGRRKTIAFISPQGHYAVGPQNVEYGAANYALWNSGPDLLRTFRTLQEANINVYQYDPRDLMASLDLVNPIGMFADNTGGRTVTRTNAPETRVTEMFVENSSYYMLGFQPPNTTPDGKFRPVDVKVSRPDVEVRARAGYFGPARARNERPPRRPESTLDKVMAGALPKGDLPMTLTAAPFAIAGRVGATVAIIGGIDRSQDLPAKDVVEIAARAFDESRADRRSRGIATAKVQLTRRASAGGFVHYDVATRLDLAPGRYQVRLALESPAAGLTGSAFVSVTVPDFAKDPLSLSGIVLGRLPLIPPVGKDPLAGLVPFTPTTMRTFAQADRVGALVRVYQGDRALPTAVTIRSRLIDQTDRTIVDDTTRLGLDVFQATPRTSEHRLELPLAELAPGEYLLSIEASRDGAATQTRYVRIKME